MQKMRLSQPKGEASDFQAMLEAALNKIHPEYSRNKSVRGVRTEFLREIETGVYASHNVYCKKGTYYHAFCITLQRDLPTPYLNSPFTAGGRFDHNRAVNMAIQRDVGRHIILSDSHQFRKGCERIIARCSAEAEKILLPYYYTVFQRSRKALNELAVALMNYHELPDPDETITGSGWSIGDLDCDMDRFRELYESSPSDKNVFLNLILASKPQLFKRLRKNSSIDLSAFT